MSDENQKDPLWTPGNLEPNKPTTFTLLSATPRATGRNSYGDWELWPVHVENVTVYDRNAKKEIKGYTGNAVCFPSPKLRPKFLEHTNGTQENVKVEITLVPAKGKKGFFTTFKTKIVEEGETPPNNLSHLEYKFVGDFRKFVASDIINNTEEDFIRVATSDTYGFTKETANKLWKVHNEEKD